MSINRRHTLATLALAGLTALAAPAAWAAGPITAEGLRSDKVFTSSNDTQGNSLLVYGRTAEGGLALAAQAATGGKGTGAGLGSQGAVTLSRDGRFVFVVNAGDHTVSTFKLAGAGLQLMSTVPSGGTQPISVTEYDGLVFVLNGGGDGNVAGFRNDYGVLKPVPGSQRGLSVAGTAGPAQVGFNADGDALVVTEKATNTLTSYRVNPDGSLRAPQFTASAGQTPFGFAFNARNRLVVTEAVGGAPGASTVSSYRFNEKAPAMPKLVSAAVADFQGAACWVAFTPMGQHAYVTNTASSNVSSYRVAPDGTLTLMQAVAGETGAGSAPIDVAAAWDGKHLYVLNAKTLTISSFKVRYDGSLAAMPMVSGLPAAAVGLAAN
ncbi:beta-propeller fold lactonase family protein [Ideonella sp. DXS29W]|uniref:Beta-propeller fold lactonase family protein n=1 Tax=Ideonella lacteola TaxID=2984193 RepID=A0ABU9BMK7_9BURK